MAAHVLGLNPLLDHLQSVKRSFTHVAFADDLSGVGIIEEIKVWWDTLMTEGPKYGYYPRLSKSFLIVKEHCKEYAERIFTCSTIKITTGIIDIIVQSRGYEFRRRISPKQSTIMKRSIEIQRQQKFNYKLLMYIHSDLNTNSRSSYKQYLISDYLLPIEETLRLRFIQAISRGHICSDA